MKPELLILEGVYSYKNRTEIDFSTLCKAELFGIFGNVGSGKSAVLEAVTYVLYGKIERLSNRVYYNMMNLASNRMYIDFTFTIRSRKYRFTFETKRNKKDFDKIETPQRSAYMQENGEWLPLFDKDGDVSADEIIGLNYDNFRRTIIVPQGRFQEFLHLEKSKRTAMLMELFRLNRFDLYSKTAHLANVNNEKAAAVDGELSGLSDATETAAIEAESEAAVLGGKSRQLSEEAEKSDKLLKELNDLADLEKQLGAARELLSEKSVAEDDYKKRKADLHVYEDCFAKFKSRLDILKMLEADVESGERRVVETRDRVDAGKNSLAEAEAQFNLIEPEYLELERWERQAGWFDELSALHNARLESMRLSDEIESGRSVLEEAELTKEHISGRLEETRAVAGAEDAGSMSFEVMNSLNTRFTSLTGMDESIMTGRKRLEKLRVELNSLNTVLEGYDALEAEQAAFFEREEQLGKKQLDAEIMKGLGRLTEQLEDGSPCPVCGALEHPAPATAGAQDDGLIQTESAALAEERAALKKRLTEFQDLKNESAVLSGRIESAAEQLKSFEAEREELAVGFTGEDFGPDEKDRFRVEFERFTRARTLREKLQTESVKLAAEQERLNIDIAGLVDGQGRLKLALAGTEAKIENTESRIDEDFLEEHRGAAATDLAEWASELRRKTASVKESYKSAEQRKKDSAVQSEKNSAELKLLEKQAAELEKNRAAAETELDQSIASSDYSGIEAVSAVLSLDIDTRAERTAVEAFEKELTGLKAEILNFEDSLGDRVFEPASLLQAAEDNRRLKTEYEQTITRLGELGNIMEGLRTRLKRKKELELEAETLLLRGKNLSLLKNVFKGKKFIDFAATIYLRDLCEAANVRFRKLTRESLRLELDEANNFIIRDYLNEGKTRSVKTLSGGQTFQAAFSLSLALADSIGRERSGFFFLDEGFGSLDRESLVLVFDSLKSLKKESRTVGVISHVEELKQEIDTFITVVKDNEEGSIIKNSWN